MLQSQIIHTRILLWLLCSRHVKAYVLKEHCNRYWNKVFKNEWCRHWQVPQRDKLRFLCVKVDKASDRERICIKRKENVICGWFLPCLPSFILRILVFSLSDLWTQDNGLRLKNVTFFLQQTNRGLFWPFELGDVFCVRLRIVLNYRSDLDRLKTACF